MSIVERRRTETDLTLREEAEAIGLALLNLAARLPEGHFDRDTPGLAAPRPNTQETMQADLYVSYEGGTGEWEIEFVPLDSSRNRCVRGENLADLAQEVLTADRVRAPHV